MLLENVVEDNEQRNKNIYSSGKLDHQSAIGCLSSPLTVSRQIYLRTVEEGMEVEGMNLEDSNAGLEEAGRQNVADMLKLAGKLKLVGKLEDKQQQLAGDMAMGDILLGLEDMKDTEVLKDSLLEDSSLEDSSSEDRKLLVEVLNKEKLKVHVHMTELMELGFFLAFWH